MIVDKQVKFAAGDNQQPKRGEVRKTKMGRLRKHKHNRKPIQKMSMTGDKCIAVTTSGKRCGNWAEDSTGYCRYHHPHLGHRIKKPSVRTINDNYEIHDYQYSKPGDDVPWKE